MDEELELTNYLPLTYKSPKEQEYIAFLWDAFETNYEHGKYQFAFLSTQAALDKKITEILRLVDEIQTHSTPVIEPCYREFLLQNHDPEKREYPDAADQIREVLIHENYMSQKDIEICLDFDLSSVADRPEIENIRTLREVLKNRI